MESNVEYEAAEEEWDNVQEIVPTFASSSGQIGQVKAIGIKETQLVTIGEILSDFRNGSQIQPYMEDAAVGNSDLSLWQELLQCCRTPLNEYLVEEKQLVFAISKCQLDDENPHHFGVLLTIYKQLTGAKFDCARFGSHWEQIGFQGNDPATDLRGVGFLGLIQPLYFVMTPELLPLAKNIYRLSLSESQNFPLLVLSINVTRIALHVLRDGLLHKQCQQENSVWSALNYFYVAVMYHVYHVWKTQHKTIKDSGYVLKDAETYCRNNVKSALANLTHHLVSNYSVHEKQSARENIMNRTRRLSHQQMTP